MLSFLTGLFGISAAEKGIYHYEVILFSTSFFFSVLWLVAVAFGTAVLYWRTLWLLPTAPLALWWPYFLLLITIASRSLVVHRAVFAKYIIPVFGAPQFPMISMVK